MDDKDLYNAKFLTKVKDLALDHKFDGVPGFLKDYWVELMWVKGVLMALNWAGYKIVKKD